MANPDTPARAARKAAGYGGRGGMARLEKDSGIKQHNIRRYEGGYVPPWVVAVHLSKVLRCRVEIFGMAVVKRPISPRKSARKKARRRGGSFQR